MMLGGGGGGGISQPYKQIERPFRAPFEKLVSEWDLQFVDVDKDTLFKMIRVS